MAAASDYNGASSSFSNRDNFAIRSVPGFATGKTPATLESDFRPADRHDDAKKVS
jgi:hypothetical protein